MREGALDGDWTMGQVEDLVKSSDALVRSVVIRYQNPMEASPRQTHRNIRKTVRLFNVEDG